MMLHAFYLDPEDARRMDALIDAVLKIEARGFRIINVKIQRGFFQRAWPSSPAPTYPRTTTFRGYPIKVVED